jgi:hypothetical protein
VRVYVDSEGNVWSMTYDGIFDEVECKQELKRAKKYIKKQADIILALEIEIEVKDYEIQKLKERKKNETKITRPI